MNSRTTYPRGSWHAALLILTLTLAGCSAPDQSDSTVAADSVLVRVMTFNIRAGNGDLAGIADVIREAAPDVVGLQEVDVHFSPRSELVDQADSLGRSLGMHVRFAQIYELPADSAGMPPRRYGTAMLSRFPVLDFTNHEFHRLSSIEEEPAPKLRGGFIEALLDVDGTHVRFFNTHLDYRGDPTLRQTQVEETLAVLGPADVPTIFIGDLNARPDAAEIAPLLDRFEDAWQGPGQGDTFPADAPERRIDYVLYSGHFQRQTTQVLATTASDHRPVVADLLLRR